MLERREVTALLVEVDGKPAGFTWLVRSLHPWSGQERIPLHHLYIRPDIATTAWAPN